MPFAIYITVDDKFTGQETAKEIVRRFEPSAYRIINLSRLSHVGVVWGWDVRCSINDEIIDRFDRLELRRAGVNGQGNFTRATDNQRATYRLVTVPNFIRSLPFERTCPAGGTPHGN